MIIIHLNGIIFQTCNNTTNITQNNSYSQYSHISYLFSTLNISSLQYIQTFPQLIKHIPQTRTTRHLLDPIIFNNHSYQLFMLSQHIQPLKLSPIYSNSCLLSNRRISSLECLVTRRTSSCPVQVSSFS